LVRDGDLPVFAAVLDLPGHLVANVGVVVAVVAVAVVDHPQPAGEGRTVREREHVDPVELVVGALEIVAGKKRESGRRNVLTRPLSQGHGDARKRLPQLGRLDQLAIV
jgi:hypothetical protein